MIWRRHLLFRLPTNPRSSHPFKKSTVCPDTSAAVPETRRASWKPDPSFASAQASTSAESTLDTLVREFLREERVPTPWYIIVPEGKGRTVWDVAERAAADPDVGHQHPGPARDERPAG